MFYSRLIKFKFHDLLCIGIQLLKCSDMSLSATLFSVVWSMTYIFHKHILFIQLIGFEFQNSFPKIIKKINHCPIFIARKILLKSIYLIFNYKTKEKLLLFVFIL